MATSKTSGSLADLCADLDGAIGKNAENPGVTQFIDTGYAPLNEAISGHYAGGLPFGRMGEMLGESSSGKTALATQWMVQAQKMGGIAGFVDWERTFAEDLAVELGLNTKRPYWIYAKPKTWEEGNTFAIKACQAIRRSKAIPDSAPILFVFDSIASAIPQSVRYDSKGVERDIDSYTMNDTSALARVTSTTLKTMAQYCEELNATFLYLNQIRLKIGVVFGDPRTSPGGKAMEYYSTFRIMLGRTKIMQQVAGEKEFVGQNIGIQVTKSKLTKPFKETEIRMSYDDIGIARFDTTYSLAELLVKEKKLVSPRNGYIEWEGKQYAKRAFAEMIDAKGLVPALNALLPVGGAVPVPPALTIVGS